MKNIIEIDNCLIGFPYDLKKCFKNEINCCIEEERYEDIKQYTDLLEELNNFTGLLCIKECAMGGFTIAEYEDIEL